MRKLFFVLIIGCVGCKIPGKQKAQFAIYYPGYILGSYRLEAKDWTVDVHKKDYHIKGAIFRAGRPQALDSVVVSLVKGDSLLPISVTDTNGKFDIRGRRGDTIRFEKMHDQPMFLILKPQKKKRAYYTILLFALLKHFR